MKLIINFILFLFFLVGSVSASQTKTKSVQEYYSLASSAFERQNWSYVVNYCRAIIHNYSQSPFAKEALFYLGIAYFNLKNYEASNKYFTRYLKDDFNPKYFEEVMYYKYLVARKFHQGERKRLFGLNRGPKVIFAKEDALAIYDEIISSMPNHDLAIKALFAKGQILIDLEEYKDSVNIFEQLIEKFPKHELAPLCFIEIGKVYLKQTTYKKQDLDILDLAELNLKNFKESFSQETGKISELEKVLQKMKEEFAKGFFNIAKFYEKTKKPDAAKLYYSKVINSFSETQVFELAKKRLDKLNEK